MGASRWEYVTPYRGSVEATLEALHDEVFQELYGDGERYASREELDADGEFMGEEGTHSILDVSLLVQTTARPRESELTDYFTVRPLPDTRLVRHFGTERPTVKQYEDVLAQAHEITRTRSFLEPDTTVLGENPMRWTGTYVVLYTDGEPSHVGFFGSSGD